MKLLVTGTFSSGKTTLAEALACELEADLVVEPSRELASWATGEDLLDGAFRAYLTVRQAVIEQQRSTREFLVIDAGMPVVRAFNKIANYDEPPTLRETLPSSTYAVVLVTDPSECPIANDGFRTTDRTLRHRIDTLVRREIAAMETTVVRVRGNQQERLEAAMRAVANLTTK